MPNLKTKKRKSGVAAKLSVMKTKKQVLPQSIPKANSLHVSAVKPELTVIKPELTSIKPSTHNSPVDKTLHGLTDLTFQARPQT